MLEKTPLQYWAVYLFLLYTYTLKMQKFSSQVRWWDWASVGLLFILLQTVASRLVATSWTPFLYLIQTVTYIGFVIGVALGYSTFQRRTVRWLTFFYMLIMLPLQWTLVIDQSASLEEQLAGVGRRLYFSLSDFFARQPVEDPLFFVALMCIGFWIISSWASFTLVRNQNYLGAVIPSAIALMIIQNYDNVVAGRLWFLAFFAFLALLLLGRMHFLQNKESWRARRIFVSPDNGVDLTSSMAVAAGLIIVVAWTVPASVSSLNAAVKTWNRLTQPWQQFTERMENAVSALESPSGGKRGEFFGSELALGRGFPLSDLVMFQVEAPEIPFDQKPPRYYWRGRTYDRFVNGQWYTTGTVREEYSPAVTNPFNVDMQGRDPAHFVFHTGDTIFSLLYAPAQPIWVNRPGVTFAVPANTEEKDVIAWHAYPSLRGGETYQLDAILSNPNQQELQEAGEDYPEWVREKYLQLPEDFSPRIRELAQQVTMGATTPYEKAIAITSYLRESITYSETLPEIPRNRDPLEWVLFEHRQAYCVYYATADVLMLRSVGVPARMAVGFAQGERDRNLYTVRRLHSHAWPEVYFPGIGWVEFEPTGNQPVLSRPLPPRDPTDPTTGPFTTPRLEDSFSFAGREQLLEEGVDPAAQPTNLTTRPPYWVALVLIAAGLAIYFGSQASLRNRVPVVLRATFERSGLEVPLWLVRWEKWVKLSPVERAFESVNFGLRLLGQAVPVHTTPVERAEMLARILPANEGEIKILLDEHQTSLYTSRIADATRARRAAFNLRMQVIVERIRSLFLSKSKR